VSVAFLAGDCDGVLSVHARLRRVFEWSGSGSCAVLLLWGHCLPRGEGGIAGTCLGHPGL